jgi:hypothetical protein
VRRFSGILGASSGFRVPSSEFRVPGSGFRVRSLSCNPELGTRNSISSQCQCQRQLQQRSRLLNPDLCILCSSPVFLF